MEIDIERDADRTETKRGRTEHTNEATDRMECSNCCWAARLWQEELGRAGRSWQNSRDYDRRQFSTGKSNSDMIRTRVKEGEAEKPRWRWREKEKHTENTPFHS